MLNPNTDPERTVDSTPTEPLTSQTIPTSDLPEESEIPPELPPGYDFLGKLGEGGMGVVYKARHLTLNRVVALKMIRAGSHASSREVLRFLSEPELTAKLHHPGIVQVYDRGQHQGLPYFTLEFCSGGALKDYLDGRPLEPNEAATLTERIAEAVGYAHSLGIIHRDLKPQNVLFVEGHETGSGSRVGQSAHRPDSAMPVSRSSRGWSSIPKGMIPKIADFGLAKLLESGEGMTETGRTIGTPAYMPPEQAEGRKAIDARADVYSLGALLYELLTGRPPLVGNSMRHHLMLVLEVDPVPVRQLNPAVPRDLETICLKCLRKEPARRYATAEELALDLKAFREGQPITARPVSWLERGWRWCRRNRAIAVSLTSIAFILVLATVTSSLLAAWGWREARRADHEANNAQKAADLARRSEEKSREAAREAQKQAQQARESADEQRKARDRSDRLLYVAQIARASTERTENLSTASRILDETRHDLRGWEYHYLRRLNEGSLLQLRSATNAVSAVAFSPDGSLIAVASRDGYVRLHDADTGELRRTLRGQADAIRAAAFSPDGDLLVTAAQPADDSDQPGEVIVWDVRTGQRRFALDAKLAHAVSALAFSPNNDRLALGSASPAAMIVDTATRQVVARLRGHTAAVLALQFSPDGQLIATACRDQHVRIWDAATGLIRHTLQGHTNPVTGVAFHPNGQQLVSASRDGTLRFWSLALGRELLRTEPHAPVAAVRFSPDGSRVFAGLEDGSVRAYESRSGREVFRLIGHTGGLTCLDVSADGFRLATGSQDQTVRLWDARQGMSAPVIAQLKEAVRGLVVSPDGRHVALSAKSPIVRIWDWTAQQETLTLKGHTRPVGAIVYHPNGSQIITGSGDASIRVWDTANGKLLRSLDGHELEVTALRVLPDGQRLLSASADRTVRLWDLETGTELGRVSTPQVPTSLAIAPDGSMMAAGPNFVGTWKQSLIEEPRMFRWGVLRDRVVIQLSADGQFLLTPARDDTVRIWNPITEKEIVRLEGEVPGFRALAFSPDRQRAVTGSFTGMVRIWDVHTGQETFRWQAHPQAITDIAFSPDGRLLFTGSLDGTVRLWDARTGPEVITLTDFKSPVVTAQFTPDAQQLLVTDKTGAQTLWDPGNGRRLFPAHMPEVLPVAPQSPDGRFAVEIDGKIVRLTLLTSHPFNPWPEDRLRRRLHKANWHAIEAKAAEQRIDWFAAGFHRSRWAAMDWTQPARHRQAARAWTQAGYPGRAWPHRALENLLAWWHGKRGLTEIIEGASLCRHSLWPRGNETS